MQGMGFGLWIQNDLAWAQGSSEYRALGTAVISVTDLFKRKDFCAGRRIPAALRPHYVGMFASLGALNWQLLRRRATLSGRSRGPVRCSVAGSVRCRSCP